LSSFYVTLFEIGDLEISHYAFSSMMKNYKSLEGTELYYPYVLKLICDGKSFTRNYYEPGDLRGWEEKAAKYLAFWKDRTKKDLIT
jgi:hypothetical protein